jgi:arylamine N-acetyltransferase
MVMGALIAAYVLMVVMLVFAGFNVRRLTARVVDLTSQLEVGADTLGRERALWIEDFKKSKAEG